METDSKFLLIDAQYQLVRHWSRCKSMSKSELIVTNSKGEPVLDDKGNPVFITDYNPDWKHIVKLFIWSIGKFTREICNAEKIILLWDKGPYIKSEIIPNFKANREYHIDEELEEFDQDFDPIGYKDLEIYLKCNTAKNLAKSFIINNLGKLGLVSIIHEGYEADDLCIIISDMLKSDVDRSVAWSIDSDWKFWFSESMNLVLGDKWYTYDKVQDEVKNVSCTDDLDNLTYKKYYDSIFGSHNNLDSSIIENKLNPAQFINSVRNNDFTFIDQKIFSANMESFDIMNYPGIDEVKSDIKNKLYKEGFIGSIEDKKSILNKEGIDISDKYYKELITFLNPNLYGTDNNS